MSNERLDYYARIGCSAPRGCLHLHDPKWGLMERFRYIAMSQEIWVPIAITIGVNLFVFGEWMLWAWVLR